MRLRHACQPAAVLRPGRWACHLLRSVSATALLLSRICARSLPNTRASSGCHPGWTPRADYLLCAVASPNVSGKGLRDDRHDCAEVCADGLQSAFWSWQGRLDRLPGGAAEQVLPGGEQAEESGSGLGAEVGADCCDVQLIGCGQFREVSPQRQWGAQYGAGEALLEQPCSFGEAGVGEAAIAACIEVDEPFGLLTDDRGELVPPAAAAQCCGETVGAVEGVI